MTREGEGWENRKNKGGKVRPSNLLVDFEDDGGDDNGREAHIRVVKQKNSELLGIEDETKATQEKTGEIVSEKPVEIVAPPKTKVKTEVENTKINSGVVWYEGILDDLKIVTSSGDEWSDVEWNKRREIATRLRNKGVKLPLLSVDEKDRVAYGNRQQFQGAVEYLNPLFMGRYRKEAIAYLNNMGIGNGTGAEYLPGSVESKEKEKEGVPLESTDNEKRSLVVGRLFRLSEAEGEILKKQLLERLEVDGVRIKKFLDDMEQAAPGKSKEVMRQLRAVTEVWRMDETKKRDFPAMTRIARKYARVLGLE